MSRIRRHGLSVVAPVALAATLLLVSCLDDPSGPGVQPGFLALAPHFESSAAGIVDVDSIHVTLIRDLDQTVALDTMVTAAADSGTVDLSFTVLVSSSGETFTLTLDCYSPSGEMVFSAGPLEVTATTSGADDVVAAEVPIEYVGVGSNAASVQIMGSLDTVMFGDTLLLQAEALDSTGTVIEGTPIKWISHDTARVVVPDAGEGLIVGNRERDWVHVEAQLLTGPADTTDVIVEPVPSAVTIVSGDGQTGTVDTELDNPVFVQVNAVDGIMQGVTVDFAVTGGGGSLAQSSAITDVSGQASTTWTLGSTVGTQMMTASVGAIATTISATANTPFEPSLSFTVQPSTVGTNTSMAPAVEVTAYDGFGAADTDFTGNITISIANNAGGSSLSGTTTIAAVSGVATFADLALDREGTGYTLLAAATGYVSATSTPFNISRAQPRQVGWINTSGGNWSNGANWNTGTPPSPSDTAVIVATGEYAVILDTDATVAVLALGDGTSQLGLSVTGTTLTVSDSMHINEFAFLTLAGNIAGDGGIFVDGTLSWTMGTIGASTPQPFHIGLPGQMALSGLDPKTIDRRQVVNYGAIDWVQGDIVLANNASLINEAGGQFGAFAGGSLSGTGLFQNSGYFVKDGPDSTIVQVPFSNLDSLNVSAGYLVLDNTFSHAMGALLQGNGTLDVTGATISLFEGDLGPGESPGYLTVEGDLTLGSNTTVFVEIEGNQGGDGFDRLNLLGNLGLAGTLDISVGQSYTPPLGNSFDVFTFTSASGDFDAVNGLDIGGGLVFDPRLLSTSYELYVMSAGPQTVTWTNASGGNWSEGANWDTGTPPRAVDYAIIDFDGTYTVALDADATVGQFNVGGTTGVQTLSLAGFTLTSNGPSLVTANGLLDLGIGVLAGTGDVTNSGTVDMGGGRIDIPLDNPGYLLASTGNSIVNGTVTTAPSSVTRVSGATNAEASLAIASGFTNAGLIDISQGTSYSGYTNTFVVTSGTLVNTGTIQSTVGARAGTRVLNANVDNQGIIELASHDLVYTGAHTLTTDAGTLTIPDGRTLTLYNTTSVVLGTNTTLTPTTTGRLVVNGNITLASDFTLASGAPAIDLDNNSTNVSTISGTGTFTNADTVFMREDSFNVPFVNQGEVRAYERGTGGFFNAAFSNTATGVLRILVENSSGVTVDNGFTNAGLIDISQGTDYTGYTSTFTVTTGTITNTGTIQSSVGLRTGTRVLNANVDNQGTIALVNHNLVFAGAHTLTTDAGTVSISEGETLTLNNGTTTIIGSGTTLTPTTSGQLVVDGNLTLASDFTLAGGAPTFNLDNNSTSVSTISGAFTFTNADTVRLRDDVIEVPFSNQGVLLAYDWTTGSVFNGPFSNEAAGVFRLLVQNSLPVTIASGFTNSGLIDISQGRAYNGFTSTLVVAAGTLTNWGTIQATVGARTGTRILDADVVNAGTIDVEAGSFNFVLSGSFAHNDGAVLQGSGTFDLSGATVTALEGDVNPGTSPGILTFDSDYAFGASSALNIELDGTAVGTQYDQLDVIGDVTLSGTLNLAAGVPLVEGNAFTVLNAASITGDFATITGLDLGGGLILDPVWTATSLSFEVVTMPPAIDYTWTGGTSTDWHEPDNWNPIGVPTDIENVWVRQAPVNQPVIGTSASVGTLVVQSGATVTIGAAGSLDVFGDIDAEGQIVGPGLLTMNGSGTALAGNIPAIDIRNAVALSGAVAVTGNLDVNNGQLTLGDNPLDITAALYTSGTGTLVMNNAAGILNTVDATFGGGSTEGSLTAGTLYVSGNFEQASTASFAASGSHRTVFNGAGVQTVQFFDPGAGAGSSHFQELEAEGSAQVELVYLYDAFVNGSLSIRGTADVNPNCQTIEVAGDLNTSESGTLTMMCSDWDNVVVAGNANFGGGSTNGRMTDGQLTVRGNFTQSGNFESFAATGNHFTYFNSDAVQTIGFTTPDSLNGSRFAHMTVRTFSSGGSGFLMQLQTPVFATGNVSLDANSPAASAQLDGLGELIVSGGLTLVTGGAGTDVLPYAVRIGGALNVGTGNTFTPNITEFFGAGTQAVPRSLTFFNLIASGADVTFDRDVDITGSFTVTGTAGFEPDLYDWTLAVGGDLIVEGNGHLNSFDNYVTVGGNFETRDSGVLTMGVNYWYNEITVDGDVTFGGGNTSGMLVDGTIFVAGDFTQTSGTSTQAFSPDSNHVVVLNGAGAQQVTFASPAFSASRFGDLQIDNTSGGGIVLNSPVFVRDDFTTPATAVTRNVFGQGYTLTAYSVDIQNMVVNNMPLDIIYDTYYSNLTDIDDVTFQNMDPTVVQLNIVRDWESGFFDNLTFSTTPTSGLYVYLDDFDDMVNNPIFEFLGTTPGYHNGFAQTDGEAQLFNWPESP